MSDPRTREGRAEFRLRIKRYRVTPMGFPLSCDDIDTLLDLADEQEAYIAVLQAANAAPEAERDAAYRRGLAPARPGGPPIVNPQQPIYAKPPHPSKGRPTRTHGEVTNRKNVCLECSECGNLFFAERPGEECPGCGSSSTSDTTWFPCG